MNKTLFEILQFIIENSFKPIDFFELSSFFGVTERMINYYIEDIQVFFKEKNLPNIISINNSTIVVNCTDEQLNQIKNVLKDLNFYDYKLTAAERKYLIEFIILFSDNHLKFSYIESILNISRTSIQNDLSSIREDMSFYNIDLIKDDNDGYYFYGSEKNKRDAAFEIIKNLKFLSFLSSKMHILYPYTEYIYRKIYISNNLDIYCNAILQTENKFNTTLTETDFNILLLLICVSVYRDKQGFFIEEDIEKDNSIVYQFSTNIYELIKKDIPYVNDNGVYYLANRLKEFNYLNSAINDENLTSFYVIIKTFIHALSNEYDVDLSNDDILIENLTSHIYDVVLGKNMFSDANTRLITEDLINQYNNDFLIIKKHISILENGLHCSFSDNDVAFILVHVLSTIERTLFNAYQPNVIIVCNSGVGTSNFLAVTITNNFNVNILTVTPAHNLNTIKEIDKCDLIISTIDIDNCACDWIKVNAVLSEEDIKNIKNKINLVSRNKVKNQNKETKFDFYKRLKISANDNDGQMFFTMKQLLKEEYIVLADQVKDWQESIRVAAKPLVTDNKITQNYVDEMIEVVNKYGPYIVFTKGIAFAHASTAQDKTKDALSILKLDKPVVFNSENNDPVYIIATFSSSNNNNRLTVLNIMNMLFDKDTISKIIDAKTSKEILRIIVDYEKTKLES